MPPPPPSVAAAKPNTSVIAGAAPCDQSLWSHVYHPNRLQVQNPCVTVTGTFVDATGGKRKDGVRKEADGDTHGWLKLDAGQEQFLNAGNLKAEEGNLVFEIVCHFSVTEKGSSRADILKACKSYKSKVALPKVGSHVAITGSWVLDDNHDRWFEIHPVTAILVK